MKYCVIPDIHGDFRSLEKIIDAYPDHHYISLGDLVDRGESSYRAFTIANDYRKAGRMEIVASNHDNKFYRWLKKWNDRATDKYSPPDFGMIPSHGMRGTIDEFFSFDLDVQEEYCSDFIEYYESCPAFIRVGLWFHNLRYFCHAGLHESMYNINDKRKQKSLFADCMYKTTTPEKIAHFSPMGKIIVYVGHVAEEGRPYVRSTTYENVTLVQTDIGIGKYITADDFDMSLIETFEI